MSAVAFLAACGDSTAPEKSLTVAITVDQAPAARFETDPSGNQVITCDLKLSARATGAGKAVWEDAVARFYFGKDRSAAVDSIPVSRDNARLLWGGEPIAPGAPQTTALELSATAPFMTTIDFRYRANDADVKTASVTFDCGPKVSANVAAPVIDNVRAEALGGELEPGDTLVVWYTAASPIGLWHTSVFVSGPCEVTADRNEPLSAAVSRSVMMILPANCEIGGQINVAVFATDAAGQTTSRHIATDYTTVDRTPPTVTAVANSRFGTGPTPFLAGTYFAGDTIDLQVRSRDNNRVRWIVWDAFQGRLKDSTTIGLTAADTRVRLPIPPGWLGAVDFHVIARDASGLTSNPVGAAPNAIEVLPTTTRPTRRVMIDASVTDLVVDSRRDVAYLLEQQPQYQRIDVLSLATARIIGSIPLAGTATAFDLTASGDSLVVGLQDRSALGIIDLRQPSLSMKQVPLSLFQPGDVNYIFALRVAANGKALISAATASPFALRLLEVDLGSGVQRVRDDAPSDPRLLPQRIERSADHSTLALVKSGCLGRYEAANDRVIPCPSSSIGYWYVSLDGSGQRTVAGLLVYDASGSLVRTLERPFHWDGAGPTAISPDGADAYYSIGSAGIAHVRVSDGQLLERIQIPIASTRVFVSPDGRWLITLPSEGGSGETAILDLSASAAGAASRRR